jgi:hypothetical protein
VGVSRIVLINYRSMDLYRFISFTCHHPREKSPRMESSAPKDSGAAFIIASAGYCRNPYDSGNSYLFANYLSHFPKPTERKTHLN